MPADDDNANTSLVQASTSSLTRRSETLALRGIRDLESKIEAPEEYRLGVQFEFGASRNLVEAAVHYRKAAGLGYLAAQSVMCDLYETGVGVERNREEAARWFGTVRDVATRSSQTIIEETASGYAICLAEFCHSGHGTPENGHEYWLKKAANASDECDRGDACYHVGTGYSAAYLKTIPTLRVTVLPTPTLVNAYMWFQLSAEAYERALNDPIQVALEECSLGAATSRWMCRLTAAEMSPAQIAEGEALATQWANGSSHNGKRILVVDAEREVREIIVSMLESTGFRCSEAASGLEALALLDSGANYDVLTTCLLMTGMDGLTLLERLKSSYPDLPAICATAIHDLSVAEAVLRAGACDYLLKPFERVQLLAIVHRCLRNKATSSR